MPNKIKPYLFVAPSIIIFLLFFIYPILYMLNLSFHDWNFISPDMKFVGLDNFSKLFADRTFKKVVQNTLVYTIGQVGITAILALVIAVVLNHNTRIHKFVQSAIFSPHIISLVSVAMLWNWLLDPDYGFINYMLSWFNIDPINWLGDQKTALFSLIMVQVWKSLGYNVIIYLSGLQAIPKEIYEAAELDRGSQWSIFTKITLPMLSPTIFFVIIMNIMSSFKVFETVQIMTAGGPVNATNTLVYYLYEQGFVHFNMGYASAAGVILFLILAIVTIFYFRLLNKRVHYK
ncbi:sugar ABC transporter permease [Facklamia sp. DSM 111018]|uniref:Sugar ABC transporter permease n=1 Tax=Facklamia lactis TaxID=2749967 RepID=A0ABS0LU89_9LACT|nr:sugar ABC transporter permease [Facklamia lactis]MBG9981140.1 sugar ABC transporter permease [Facklamia lactis]MBG9986941.1 sugar ABC transporter permease [Facklamia lactis]